MINITRKITQNILKSSLTLIPSTFKYSTSSFRKCSQYTPLTSRIQYSFACDIYIIQHKQSIYPMLLIQSLKGKY